MIRQKAYKFRIYPTEEQRQKLAVEFGNARFVWNHALAMRTKAYKRRKESLNYISLGKHITHLKKTDRFKWLSDSTACVLTQKLIDQDTAFKNFFKHGFKYPRFKKKSHAQSIRYQIDQRHVAKNYKAGEFLKLPNIGELNIKWSQIPQGVPKMATISQTASGDYYVSFACEVEISPLPKTSKSVGVDVGIKDVVVTSDEFFSGAPKFTYKYARQLKKAQRNLSRKTKGSNRWEKQRLAVAKIHEKISACRKDFLHKLTTKLVREYDYISIEDLNVSGMLKNRKLSKAIADVGLHELKRQLEYKADWYGKEITVIDRWFPSTKTCSCCGQIHNLKLSDRVITCGCGLNLNRDLNAAINIKQAGLVCRGASNQSVIACIEQRSVETKKQKFDVSLYGTD